MKYVGLIAHTTVFLFFTIFTLALFLLALLFAKDAIFGLLFLITQGVYLENHLLGIPLSILSFFAFRISYHFLRKLETEWDDLTQLEEELARSETANGQTDDHPEITNPTSE